MKTNLAVLPILIAFSLALALRADDKTESKPAPLRLPQQASSKSEITTNASTAQTFPVICYIEKRDRTIAVKAGPNGTVYSVRTADGKVLCENIALEQLRAQAPELHDFIKSAIVLKSERSDARVRLIMDASMR